MLADASLLQSLAIGLVIAGVIILAWTFRAPCVQIIPRLIRRAQGNAPSSPSHTDSTRPPDSLPVSRSDPSTLKTVMDDAEELAQLISDRLDRQAARLEQLIAAADDRLTRLEHAAARPTAAPVSAPRRETADPLALQVYTLSDRGLPPVEIARRLNQHTGKVELILALRQK